MRLLMLIVVVCFAVAFLGQVGVISGVDTFAWAFAGWLVWAIDVAIGGYVFHSGQRRAQPPA